MIVINCRNVSESLARGIDMLLTEGVVHKSRAGDVVVYPTPVTTIFRKPTERVLLYEERDANPFFHIFEALWMLAGRNDVSYVKKYVKTIEKYSDDGITFNGAYGYRWRRAFGFDQIEKIVQLLKNCPNTRRAVLQMWFPPLDLFEDEDNASLDVCCNTAVYFWMSSDGLNITVTNRSNDIIWGLYGSNAVHFSILQEYVASRIGAQVGKYYHISNNYHAYLDILDKCAPIRIHAPDPYRTVERNPYLGDNRIQCYPLVSDSEHFMEDLNHFMGDEFDYPYKNKFFREVVIPLEKGHRYFKNKKDPDRFDKALVEIAKCKASDWKTAAEEWIIRRRDRAKRVQTDNRETSKTGR